MWKTDPVSNPKSAVCIENRPTIQIQVLDNGFSVQLGEGNPFSDGVLSATVCYTLGELTAEVVRVVTVLKLKVS